MLISQLKNLNLINLIQAMSQHHYIQHKERSVFGPQILCVYDDYDAIRSHRTGTYLRHYIYSFTNYNKVGLQPK